MATNIKDLQIQDNIMEVLDLEVKKLQALQKNNQLDERGILLLEKLAKTYATVMGSHRENLKYGLYGDVSGEEPGDGLGDSGNTTHGEDDAD